MTTTRWSVLAVGLAGVGVALLLLLRPAAPVVTPAPKLEAIKPHEKFPAPKITFTDVTQAAGITFRHVSGAAGKKLLPETMGSGVAFVDFNGDGLPDLFFVNSRQWPGSVEPLATQALYLNRGGGRFEDASAEWGIAVPLYGQGVCVGDFDNDGFEDLFISCVGEHRLYRNDQGKRFVDATAALGPQAGPLPSVGSPERFLDWADPVTWGSSCTFLDYDGDGKLDLFVAAYVTWSPKIDLTIDSTLGGNQRAYPAPKDYTGAHCRLYRNLGDGRFADVSKQAGVQVVPKNLVDPRLAQRPEGKSLGVILCDPDDDGWPDLMVANDTVKNFFFHNVPGPDGTRRFEEIGYESGVALAEGTPRGGMGIDWAEYAPGKRALVIANFANEPDTFLMLDRPKELLFRDAARTVGLHGPSQRLLKFGTFFFDYDLDGRLDLLTTNGHLEPDISLLQGQQYAQPAQLFWNTGRPECYFEEVTREEAGKDLFRPIVGRGSAYADFDGDGDLDVVFTTNNGPPLLLRNDAPATHRGVRLLLRGDGVNGNRSAIGAKLEIQVGGQTLHREVAGARGYLSQSEYEITVGLGAHERIDRVTVRWPGPRGGSKTWESLAPGKVHLLQQ